MCVHIDNLGALSTTHMQISGLVTVPVEKWMTVMLGQQGHKRGRQRLAVPETRKCSENDTNMSRGIRSQLKGARTGPWRNNFRIRRNKKNRTLRFK